MRFHSLQYMLICNLKNNTFFVIQLIWISEGTIRWRKTIARLYLNVEDKMINETVDNWVIYLTTLIIHNTIPDLSDLNALIDSWFRWIEFWKINTQQNKTKETKNGFKRWFALSNLCDSFYFYWHLNFLFPSIGRISIQKDIFRPNRHKNCSNRDW